MNVLTVFAHPSSQSFCHAVLDRFDTGLREAAYARHDDADAARAAGFQMHLSKPIDAGQLVDAVTTVLQTHVDR